MGITNFAQGRLPASRSRHSYARRSPFQEGASEGVRHNRGPSTLLLARPTQQDMSFTIFDELDKGLDHQAMFWSKEH